MKNINPRCSCGGMKRYDGLYDKNTGRTWVCAKCGAEGFDSVNEDRVEIMEGKEQLLLEG